MNYFSMLLVKTIKRATFIFAYVSICHADTTNEASLSFENAWFKPELIENLDAACPEILKDATTKYFSSNHLNIAYGLAGYGQQRNGQVLDWKILGGMNLREINAYGKTFYLDYLRHPGCGGACETYQPLLSTKSIPKTDNNYLKELAKNAPPPKSYNYLIAEGNGGVPYLFVLGEYGDSKEKLYVYKLVSEGLWKTACTVSFVPKSNSYPVDMQFPSVFKSINQLKGMVAGMSQGVGECGSMQTHRRWAADVKDKIDKVLYRPWAIEYPHEYAGNSYAIYDKNLENLEKWSLGGLHEYNAFIKYQEQLEQTINDVKFFYQFAFGWSTEASAKLANTAVKSAVSYGFGFYMYNPSFYEHESALRKAILRKASIEEIKKIPFSPDPKKNDIRDCCSDLDFEDSILNIAVDYPEALQYLLAKGVNPNQGNAFGKTSLMYAVQHNQKASVSLLLEKGADPNISTIIPEDNCYYTLSKSGMTALHYAVRYASADIVDILLKAGANPYATTSEKQGGRPVDWLTRYAITPQEETNPYISKDVAAQLHATLSLPIAEKLSKLVSNYNLQAEKFYQEGKKEDAYKVLQLAVNLSPENDRTLANLGVITMRIGRVMESLEASQKVIENSKDPTYRANAWFNYGLVCENNKINYKSYNGRTYCDKYSVYYFLESYNLKPGNAKASRIIQSFKEQKTPNCAFSQDIYMTENLTRYGSGNLLYILHPKTIEINASKIHWTVKGETFTPQSLVKLHSFGDFVLEIYRASEIIYNPIIYDNQVCDRKSGSNYVVHDFR